MSTPGALRIERPYDSVEDYLEGDAWTVARSDMLLVGAEGVAQGTLVKFEIVIASGDPVVRGEGRVLEAAEADAGRPGGIRVRFQRLEGDSKAMLRRALQKRTASARLEEMKSAPEASPPPAPPVVRDVAPVAVPERSGVRHRAALPIVAPGNRDTLLARLRERAPRVAGTR
jgi:hypothetical protein